MPERFDIDVNYRDPWKPRDEWPEDGPSPSEYEEDPECPATAEAVWEEEEHGELGCPLCGRRAVVHRRET